MSYAPITTEPTLETPNNIRNNSQSTSSTLSKSQSFTRAGSNARTKSVGAKGRASRNGADDSKNYPIIVHCHLCWDWVWQRPQQFLSRLSQRHKILFVETIGPDPQLATPVARYRTAENSPNITILRLQFPSWRWGDSDYVDSERRRIVQEFVAEGPLQGQFENPVQWFYDPMAVPAFAGHMKERLTVYDCMDELSKFKGAPPQIIQREATLLKTAEVVFTGGRKLFESKRQHNDNCHFYGCGVDGEHFGKARSETTAVPEQLQKLKKPVLGYFGVVDERMDYELVAALADANSDWSVAIVGPVMKVDPGALPQRPNLHWLGQQTYRDLPAFCKGFDVCLMPFALNESTEFINPTKALEYMATGRMIVSTAVPDVVSNFGTVAKVANSKEEFIELCRKAVMAPEAQTIERGLQMVGDNSWEAIVAKLEHHIEEALVSTGKVKEAA